MAADRAAEPDRIRRALEETLPRLFRYSPGPEGGVRVETPLLRPDGGPIQVLVLVREEGYVVTDSGDALETPEGRPQAAGAAGHVKCWWMACAGVSGWRSGAAGSRPWPATGPDWGRL